MQRIAYFTNRAIRAPLLAAAALLVAACNTGQAVACSRCGYAVCRFANAPAYYTAAPYVAPSYDYVDHRFQVTDNITFPPPAASGATAYAYTPPTLSLLDPALYLNSASRYIELSQATSQQGFQQFNQTSQLILQGQQGVGELRARERLLEKATQLVAANGPGHGEIVGRFSKPAEQDTIRLERSMVAPLRSPAGLENQPTVGGVEGVVAAKCVRCHGPELAKAGLRLDNLPALDQRYEAKIIAKILADDPADRMPPPGAEKLTLPEKLTFLRTSGICGKSSARGQ